MNLERNGFRVFCDKKLDYLDEILDYLDNNLGQVKAFFNCDLNDITNIVIWTDLEKYKKHIEQYFPFKDFMCADICDGNVNILSLEETHKEEEHKDMDLFQYKINAKHEFVHICQNILYDKYNFYEGERDEIPWFYEALATNIGNPECFSIINLDNVNWDLFINDFNSCKEGYPAAYTIGKYMLENYSHDEIINYIINLDTLRQDQENIFRCATNYANEKIESNNRVR